VAATPLVKLPPVIKNSYVAACTDGPANKVDVWDISSKTDFTSLDPVWEFDAKIFGTKILIQNISIEGSTLLLCAENSCVVHQLSWRNSNRYKLLEAEAAGGGGRKKLPEGVEVRFRDTHAHTACTHAFVDMDKNFIYRRCFGEVELFDIKTGARITAITIPFQSPFFYDDTDDFMPQVWIDGPLLIIIAVDVHVFDLSNESQKLRSRRGKATEKFCLT